MAFIQCHFFSEVLRLHTSMTVLLPQQTKFQVGMRSRTVAEKPPVLYLLHGMSDDDTMWLRKTSIERYAAELGLAVIMPQVHRSNYTDMVSGGDYWTFLTKELPDLAHSFFQLSERREHNFVAGLSMGGYGAFKWALQEPERFAAAASLSGALDKRTRPENPDRWLDYDRAFGTKIVAETGDDVFWLLHQCSHLTGNKPRLYQCCGTEDFLYEENQQFRQAAQATMLDYTYEEEPGAHEWSYWDKKIQDVLKWLPLHQA